MQPTTTHRDARGRMTVIGLPTPLLEPIRHASFDREREQNAICQCTSCDLIARCTAARDFYALGDPAHGFDKPLLCTSCFHAAVMGARFDREIDTDASAAAWVAEMRERNRNRTKGGTDTMGKHEQIDIDNVREFSATDAECPVNMFTSQREPGWYWRDPDGSWDGPAPGGRDEALDHARAARVDGARAR